MSGDPYRNGRTPEERFWNQVDTSAGPDACWPWVGFRDRDGYGKVTISRVKLYAHRVAFEWANGPVPEGSDLAHSCDNPPCVNPAHLSAETHAENLRQSSERHRMHFGTRHPRARFTDDDIRRIRSGAETRAQLAAEFGVSEQTIGKIARRERWPHVA